jgi:hypothetical protein
MSEAPSKANSRTPRPEYRTGVARDRRPGLNRNTNQAMPNASQMIFEIVAVTG